jgi:circadian clock protein KaiB
MPRTRTTGAARTFWKKPAAAPAPRYLLRLYVTGTTRRSTRAIQNIKRICEEQLQGRYDLEVVDIYQQPSLARGEQIVAVPTLIKRLPLPVRRLIGDLSDENHVLLGLDLRRAGPGR